MSSEWDQTCLVCGIKTEIRCSSCAKAGIDLFFCSPDHQKLVWKAHRRVCGPGKANPFMWPLLSQLEADEIVKHMHESTGQLQHADSDQSTVAQAMQFHTSVPPELLPNVVQLYVSKHVPSSSEEIRPQAQHVLPLLRAYEALRQTPDNTDGFISPPGLDPIAILSCYEIRVMRTPDWPDEPWRTKWRHLMLASVVILEAWSNESKEPPPVDWIAQSHSRLDDFIRTTVAPTHPKLADKLLKR